MTLRNVVRLLLILAGAVGLVCTWIPATSPLNPLVYFTVQSNILLLTYNLWAFNGRSSTLKGAVTLYISITGLVAHFILMDGANPFPLLTSGDVGDVGEFFLHYVTPVLALVDWLAFDHDLRPRWIEPLKWLAFPAAYFVFALVRGLFVHRYPYPFLDVNRLGYGGVAVQAVFLALFFAALGYTLVALHRLASRKPALAMR
ncbi:Pr6Pr family membrane protein [Nonomuraea sp. NPDC050556]|uniref:Pr6Pr family membrane protein n=1 Tax=Nonomuraea sp. NPDC050556 TaxID=3364369 RepID=UPI0037954DCE